MDRARNDAMQPDCLAFLSMFLARTHRSLYRAQCVAGLGAELGFPPADARHHARKLCSRGLLRLVSSLPADGPLMQITPRGIEAVQRGMGDAARRSGEA